MLPKKEISLYVFQKNLHICHFKYGHSILTFQKTQFGPQVKRFRNIFRHIEPSRKIELYHKINRLEGYFLKDKTNSPQNEGQTVIEHGIV